MIRNAERDRLLGGRQPPPPWTIAYVCRPLDPQNPNSATQILWVRALANEPRVRHIHVVTSGLGPIDLPPNVSVHVYRKGRGGRLLSAIPPFYGAMTSIPEPFDFSFVVGGGPYPALLLPIRLATGRPTYHWKALPVITPRMRFYVRFCDDLVFTATPSSLPLNTPKKRVVGHGIDTERFTPGPGAPDRDLLVLGRISPIKNIQKALELVASASLKGNEWSLDLVGPVNRKGRPYEAELRRQAKDLGISGQVNFLGPVDHSEVPLLLRRYRAMISYADTAFDKAVGEAMASGLPVLTTNPAVLEDLPRDLLEICALPEELTSQVERVSEVINPNGRSGVNLAQRLRAYVEKRHSLPAFFVKILDEIEDATNVSTTG